MAKRTIASFVDVERLKIVQRHSFNQEKGLWILPKYCVADILYIGVFPLDERDLLKSIQSIVQGHARSSQTRETARGRSAAEDASEIASPASSASLTSFASVTSDQ